MEQGDHVIKPNWNSWQFGNSYQYNGWRGIYNGKGNKSEGYNRILTRDKDILNRNVSPLSNRYSLVTSNLRGSSYGNTQIKEMEEPAVEWEVSAGINPRRVEKIAPLSIVSKSGINFENPEMPAFEVPDGDVEVPPAPVIPNTTLLSTTYYYYQNPGDYSNIKNGTGGLLAGVSTEIRGPISQTNIRGINGRGKFEILHNNNDKFTIKTDNTSFIGIEGTHNPLFTYNNNLNNEYSYYNSTTKNMGVRLGGGHDFEIENMDIISSGTVADELTDSSGNKFRHMFSIIEVNGNLNKESTATLKQGSTIVSDTRNTFGVFLYNGGAIGSKPIKFINEGFMKSTKIYGGIVTFLNNFGNATVSNFTNNGDILLDGVRSNVVYNFLNTPAYYMFVNNGNITLKGTSNYGIQFTSTIRNTDHPISIFQLNKPIVIEGNWARGFDFSRLSRNRLFEAVVNGNLEKSFFNIEMYGENNTGMRIGNGTTAQSGLVEFKNFKLKSIDGKNNTLVRINRQSDIKFLKDGDNEELTIEGGDGNIGLNVQGSTGMVNEGVVTIKESTNGKSKNAIGIVSFAGSAVENKGKMIISGDRARALYAAKDGKIENHAEITFDGTTTESSKGSTGMYANQGGIIESDGTTKIKVSKPKSVGLFAENRGDSAGYLNTSKIKISKAEITATEGAFNIFANKGGEIQLENDVVLNTGKDSLAFYTAYTPSTPGGKIIFDRDVTANIKKGGTVFYYDLANAPVGTFNFASWYANNFSHNNNSKLKLNMENGGRVMFLANGNLALSSIPINLTATGPIEITGSGYISAAMVNSFLELDQDINLDNASDTYNTLEILGSSITNSKNITGSKNKQLGIAQENNGTNPASKIKLIDLFDNLE